MSDDAKLEADIYRQRAKKFAQTATKILAIGQAENDPEIKKALSETMRSFQDQARHWAKRADETAKGSQL